MTFKANGYVLVNNFITSSALAEIKAELANTRLLSIKGGIRQPEEKYTSIKRWVSSNFLYENAEKYLGQPPKFVRSILFDKSSQSNWLVPWHQDKTIAVSHKVEVKGWGPWSVKSGRHHVQPDSSILNCMLTIRLHLDDSNIENGCLKLIPKSHTLGIMTESQIHNCVKENTEHYCEAKAGSALIMRPLTLHASSKATRPLTRRVLHIEFCSAKLPKGLNWI